MNGIRNEADERHEPKIGQQMKEVDGGRLGAVGDLEQRSHSSSQA